MTQPAAPPIPYAEYVAQEARSDRKHEYLRGEVWAMAGGTPEHGRLAARMAAALGRALVGRPCETFTSDVRVRVAATDFASYPDLSVVCGKLETSADDRNAITNPMIVVEILSAGTERYDRADKFAHYRRIPSLREYVLVSQEERRIEVYRRRDDGEWSLAESGPGETAALHSIDATVAVDAIYESALARLGLRDVDRRQARRVAAARGSTTGGDDAIECEPCPRKAGDLR